MVLCSTGRSNPSSREVRPMPTVRRSHAAVLTAAVLGVALVLGARPAAAQTSVGGVVYAQWMYTLAYDTLTRDSNITHINNFDIARAYINVNGSFAGGVKGRVTADIWRPTGGDGSLYYRLKYAYVSWTPEHSPLTFKLGQVHTPWVDFEEALWNYRMQGTVAMDRMGYETSSDFGAGVDGTFKADRVNFQAGIYGGEKYSGALGDQRKDLEARASVRLVGTDDGSRVGGLRLTGYAHLGAPTTGGQRNRFIGMVSYRSNDLTLAAQYGAITDSTTGGPNAPGAAVNAVGAVAQKKATVVSAYGVYHFPSTRFSVLGRVDLVNTNTADTTHMSKTTRFIAGVAYQVSPNLRLLADLDMLSYHSGYAPTASTYAAYVNRNMAYLQAMYSF